MREDQAAYLGRLGIPQGPADSTSPYQVGYAQGSEPEPEEATMPRKQPVKLPPPVPDTAAWSEVTRSTVISMSLKLTGYPALTETTGTYVSRQFLPTRMRFVLSDQLGTVKIIAARISGRLLAQNEVGDGARVLPLELGAPGWPIWAVDIVKEVMDSMEKTQAEIDAEQAKQDLEREVTHLESQQ